MSNFIPPYRLGEKQKRAVLDSNGFEVVIFREGLEDMAKEYVEFLNKDKKEDVVNKFVHKQAIKIAESQDEIILRVLNKQSKFISFEDSKDLISVHYIIINGQVATDIFFDNKKVLTIYQTTFRNTSITDTTSIVCEFNYKEY